MIDNSFENFKMWLDSVITECNDQELLFENAGLHTSAACSRAMASAYIIAKERFNKIKKHNQEDTNKTIDFGTGKLIHYCGFTQSNRNNLTIEVWGMENYMGNVVKVGGNFKLSFIHEEE